MTHRSRALTRAVIVAAAAATAAVPHPAFAESPFPRAWVWIESFSGAYANVCAQGDVNDGFPTMARWVFTISNAVPAGAPWIVTPSVRIAASDSFFDCQFVFAGPPDTVLVATLAYAGATTDINAVSTTDLVGVAGIVYEWNSPLGSGNATSFGSNG